MCALRQARILSSETDNTIKQEQNTNVNIKITPQNKQERPNTVPLYPPVQPLNPNVNFTQANPQMGFQEVGIVSDSQMNTQCPASSAPMMNNQNSQSQYQPPTNNQSQLIRDRGTPMVQDQRSIADLSINIDELEKKNQFLEMLVEMYETNPLKINSYVVCKSSLLMNMIKLLTECDIVDLVIDDSDIGCGCSASNTKILKIDKILITIDDKTEEFKYKYNDIYTQFVKYGVSLKLTL